MAMLKQNEDGAAVADISREHSVSQAQFYKWRSKYGGMDVSMVKRLKELEEENSRLKKMYAEEKLISDIRKEVIEKKWQGHLSAKRWPAELLHNSTSAFGLLAPP